ncbi:MAG: riboflavin synthase [Candidatus Omnitrophica bacterium]|nr:riboflavin synthase [Candidatus Omnitrophota bacterium]
MFTGIIETSALVVSAKETPMSTRLTVRPKRRLGGVRIGESIATNGVCLTVVQKTASSFSFDVIAETLRKSNLGDLKHGSLVNLERSLVYGQRLHGHYVLGHAEGTGRIGAIRRGKKDVEFFIKVPARLLKHIPPKGCVAVDGISLTVGRVTRTGFSVYLIPHTIAITNLHTRKPGDRINIETDILVRARKFANIR